MISTADLPAVQMSAATGYWNTSPPGQAPPTVERGFVFPEQLKDAITFANSDNLQKTQFTVTTVYWPLNSQVSINLGGTAANPVPVTWNTPSQAGGCPASGDVDIPNYAGLNYARRGQSLLLHGQHGYRPHAEYRWNHFSRISHGHESIAEDTNSTTARTGPAHLLTA